MIDSTLIFFRWFSSINKVFLICLLFILVLLIDTMGFCSLFLLILLAYKQNTFSRRHKSTLFVDDFFVDEIRNSNNCFISEMFCRIFFSRQNVWSTKCLSTKSLSTLHHRVSSICIRRVYCRHNSIVRCPRFDMKLARKNDKFRRRRIEQRCCCCCCWCGVDAVVRRWSDVVVMLLLICRR